jgi:hypothetical protein
VSEKCDVKKCEKSIAMHKIHKVKNDHGNDPVADKNLLELLQWKRWIFFDGEEVCWFPPEAFYCCYLNF